MSQSIVLSFEKAHAKQFGTNEALILYHLRYWIEINHASSKNEHEGKTWTYQTFEAIQAHFSFMSKSTIQRAIDDLVKKHKVIVKGNFNKNKFDRTIWYAFVDQDKWIREDYKNSNRPHRDGQNDHIGNSKMGNGECQSGSPIPKDNTKDEHKNSSPNGEEKNAREKFGAYVKLTKIEKEALEKEHGAERIKEKIEAINDYLASTGKKPYKDYAATIRRWFKNEKDKRSTQSSHQQIDRSHRDANGQKINSDYERLF